MLRDLENCMTGYVSLCVYVSMSGDSSQRGSSRQCKSVQLDVTGKPRKTKVRLPTCILSSKPRSVPNQQVPKHSHHNNYSAVNKGPGFISEVGGPKVCVAANRLEFSHEQVPLFA